MKSLITAIFITAVIASPSSAQPWRVQVSGGILKPDVLVGVSDGVTHPIKCANGYYLTLPLYRGAVSGIAGLSVLRSDSSMEYGVSVQALPLHFSQFFFSTPEYNPDSIWLHQAYLAKPAIPVTAVFNYMHHRSRSHVFIGANAGIVVVRGQKTEDFSHIELRREFTLFFNNAIGYTIGAQLGYRYETGKADFGFQLQANYVRLSLTHGSEERHYNFNVICLPVTLYAGYRF